MRGIDSITGTIPIVVKDRVLNIVKDHFKPEFLNRLDDIVIFHPLLQSQLSQIVTLQLAALAQRLLTQERNISLQPATPAAIRFILSEATKEQPEYGARPLKRWIEKHVTTTLATFIIQGSLSNNSTVQLDYDSKQTALIAQITQKNGKKQTVTVFSAAATGVHDPVVGNKRNVKAEDLSQLTAAGKKINRNARVEELSDEDEEDNREKMEL